MPTLYRAVREAALRPDADDFLFFGQTIESALYWSKMLYGGAFNEPFFVYAFDVPGNAHVFYHHTDIVPHISSQGASGPVFRWDGDLQYPVALRDVPALPTFGQIAVSMNSVNLSNEKVAYYDGAKLIHYEQAKQQMFEVQDRFAETIYELSEMERRLAFVNSSYWHGTDTKAVIKRFQFAVSHVEEALKAFDEVLTAPNITEDFRRMCRTQHSNNLSPLRDFLKDAVWELEAYKLEKVESNNPTHRTIKEILKLCYSHSNNFRQITRVNFITGELV